MVFCSDAHKSLILLGFSKSSVSPLIPRRSKVRFAPTSFYAHSKKTSSTRSLAPPFPNHNRFAGLRFGFRRKPGNRVIYTVLMSHRRSKLCIACSGFFAKIRPHFPRCFSSPKRARFDLMNSHLRVSASYISRSTRNR